MRILFSTVPAHGHLLPLLPLADAAKREGHDVVVATGREGVIEAVRRGFTAWDVGPSRAETDAAFRAAVPDLSVIAPEQRIPTVVAGVFGAAAFRRAEQLVPRAIEWSPDVVVHSISELAGAIAAARTGAETRRPRSRAAAARGLVVVRLAVCRAVPTPGTCRSSPK